VSKAEKLKSKSKGDSSYKDEIEGKDKAFLFYATWCPFSQSFLPVFEEYARSNSQALSARCVRGALAYRSSHNSPSNQKQNSDYQPRQ